MSSQRCTSAGSKLCYKIVDPSQLSKPFHYDCVNHRRANYKNPSIGVKVGIVLLFHSSRSLFGTALAFDSFNKINFSHW